MSSAEAKALVTSAVQSRQNELVAHAASGNVKAAETFLHADFVSIDAAGHSNSRDQELANIRSGKLKLQSGVVEKLEVHPIGNGLAIATGVARATGTFDGKSISGTYTFNQVWSVGSSSGEASPARAGSTLMACINTSFKAE